MSGVSTDRELRAQLILDHARTPVGRTLSGDATRGEMQARQYSPSCGDEVTVRLRIDGDGRVAELAWTGHGCAVSQASASMLAALVLRDAPSVAELRERSAVLRAAVLPGGAELDETLFADAAALGGSSLTPHRAGCASLAWRAVEEALGGVR